VPGDGITAEITDSDGVSRTINYDYSGSAVTLYDLDMDLTGGSTSATNTLNIAANNLAVTNDEEVGLNGSATIDQTGGTNTIVTGGIYLSRSSGSSSFYNLSGTGTITGGGGIFVGGLTGSTATFNQSGGTISLTNFSRGDTIDVLNGTYNLSAGSLTSDGESVAGEAAGSAGTFIQTGGVNTAGTPSGGGVSVGGVTGASGSYVLDNGQLIGASEYTSGNGTFTQNGGTNTIVGSPGGISVLSVTSGAYVLNHGTLNVNAIQGTFTMNGGTLNAVQVRGSINQTGGHATLDGIEFGDISVTGGELTQVPDNLGSITSFLEDVTVGGTGVLNLELGGYTQGVNYDWENDIGSMSLGGTLDLDLANGFVPQVGDQFTIMSLADGSISGAFDELTSDDPGLNYTVSYGPSDNMVEVTITSVPEPALLLGFLGPGFLMLRRRTRV
jgi:hypothetical protein